MNYLTVLCVLSGLSLCAGQGLRPYNETAKRLFDQNDKDKDLQYTMKELYLSFEGFDANLDGVVSREEYTMYQAHQAPEMFALTHALYDIYDQDKDGILTEYDYSHIFELWDTNENGKVSEKEFIHWWTTTLESLDHLHQPDATRPASV